MLRQTLGHGILAFRRAGTVLVVHVPSGHLLLLEAT
jgi:hypothetical protein